MKLFDLNAKYGFTVDGDALVVPADITTEDLQWLVDNDFSVIIELSPVAYVAAREMLKSKEGGEK